MAHFYANLEGSAKTSVTRTGTAGSGIHTHIRGWDAGVQVWGRNLPATKGGGDRFAVEATYGSNARGRVMPIGYVQENSDGTVSFYPSEHVLQAIADNPESPELRF